MKVISKIHPRSIVLLLLLTLAISACEKIELGKPVECLIGERYRITNSVTFTIDSLRDYRCPADVMCIWSGDVDLHFTLHDNFSYQDTLINLYTHNNNPFTSGGYTYRIEDVIPHLNSGQTAKQDDYRVKMVITKN